MPELIRKLAEAAAEARAESERSAGLSRVRLAALADTLTAQARSLSREAA